MKRVIIFIFIFCSLKIFCQLSSSNGYNKTSEEKYNLFGFDTSFGPSIVHHRKAKLGYSAALNYSRVSKKSDWIYEFGVRFTRLNYTSNRLNYTPSPTSDTFTIFNGNILFFDVPIVFRKSTQINKRTSLLLNFGVYYSTYVRWYSRVDHYFDDGIEPYFLFKKERLIKPQIPLSIGIEGGLGIAYVLNEKYILYVNGNLDIRGEFEPYGRSYFYPNLLVGLRQRF